MLEPRIVAASTHGRDFAAHGVGRAPALTGTSLHGSFISNSKKYGTDGTFISVGHNEAACGTNDLARMEISIYPLM